jgi:hypothetical protein
MSLFIVVAFAAAASFVAYAEISRDEKRAGEALFGITPELWALGGFVVGFVTATVVPVVVVGALTFVAGFEGALALERHLGDRLRKLPAPAWGGVSAVGAVAVSVVAAPVFAGAALTVLSLVGELALTMMDNKKLTNENYALHVENKKLVAQRDALQAEHTPTPAPASASANDTKRAPLLRMAPDPRQAAPRPQSRANAPERSWLGPSAARPDSDLLPGSAKRRPVAARPASNDFLPRHR